MTCSIPSRVFAYDNVAPAYLFHPWATVLRTKRGSPGLDMNRFRRVGDSSKILRTALSRSWVLLVNSAGRSQPANNRLWQLPHNTENSLVNSLLAGNPPRKFGFAADCVVSQYLLSFREAYFLANLRELPLSCSKRFVADTVARAISAAAVMKISPALFRG
jgi:hypothetical protein